MFLGPDASGLSRSRSAAHCLIKSIYTIDDDPGEKIAVPWTCIRTPRKASWLHSAAGWGRSPFSVFIPPTVHVCMGYIFQDPALWSMDGVVVISSCS